MKQRKIIKFQRVTREYGIAYDKTRKCWITVWQVGPGHWCPNHDNYSTRDKAIIAAKDMQWRANGITRDAGRNLGAL